MWLTSLLNFFRKPKKEEVKKGYSSHPRTVVYNAPWIDPALRRQLWAIGGGKGGVGKSLMTVMLGASLTRWGKKVILVDADLGGSNLNLLTGITHPPYTLVDFMQNRVDSIEEITLDTPIDNLKVICGADDILGIANPKDTQKTRLLNNLKKLDADFILLDLGAGTSYTTLDFFLFAPNRIIVMSPQNTAIQNAYGFVKTCLLRKLSREFSDDPECMRLINRCSDSGEEEKIGTIVKLREAFEKLGPEQIADLSACIDEFNFGLVVNMAKEQKDINLGRSFIKVANDYMTLKPENLGYITHDKRLERSINRMGDFLKNSTEVITEMGFYDLSNRIIKNLYKESIGRRQGVAKPAAASAPSGDPGPNL
ncbi:MAG: P-loop NTPase [Nitrospirota bacterium]|nr:P-loop NTPase [Nitrospirota bacterium]